MNMNGCTRCGRCCHYELNGVIKKCKHLVRTKDGTLCRIFHKRLGTIIDKDKEGNVVKCMLRAQAPYDYKDSPLNTDKPIFDVGY